MQYGQGWYRAWLAFSATLAVGLCLCLVLRQSPNLRRSPPIVEGDVRDVVASIRRAPRAVVYLEAPTSVDAVIGRRIFNEAVSGVTESEFPSTTFVILDEWPSDEGKNSNRDFVQTWLRSLSLKELPVGNGYGIGAGSLIWLEEGRVIHEEWSAKTLNAAGIIDRTRKLWPPR